MTDPAPLWDFEDPAGSEERLRSAAATASATAREVLMTQVARAMGLQERYDDAHALLDRLEASAPEVQVRVALERGRLLRSAGQPQTSRPWFERAERQAGDRGLVALQVDALHMLAIVARPDERLALNLQALGLARGSDDPRARDWDAALLNNIGMVHADAGNFPAALASFKEALLAAERIGDPARTRVARWMVAWTLRRTGHREEALAMQVALKAELDAAGERDPFVDEELALLQQAPSV